MSQGGGRVISQSTGPGKLLRLYVLGFLSCSSKHLGTETVNDCRSAERGKVQEELRRQKTKDCKEPSGGIADPAPSPGKVLESHRRLSAEGPDRESLELEP